MKKKKIKTERIHISIKTNKTNKNKGKQIF